MIPTILGASTILGGIAAIVFFFERWTQRRRQRKTMQHVWNGDREPKAHAFLVRELGGANSVVAIVPATKHNWHNAGSAVPDEKASTGQAWLSDAQDAGGHVVYGPYEKLSRPGPYRALFRFRIDPETVDARMDALRLDVIQHAGGLRAETRVPAQTASVEYALQGVNFEYLDGGRLEMRVEKLQSCRVWVDFAAVCTSNRKRQVHMVESPTKQAAVVGLNPQAGSSENDASG